MQARQPKMFTEAMCALGCLALIAAACSGSDADPVQEEGGVAGGGGAVDSGTPALDGSAFAGSDAAPSQADDAGIGGGTGGGQDAGPALDASSNSVDGGSNDAASGAEAGNDAAPPLERFSFFVTSLSAMRQLSGSQNGFGGDLTFGETGEGAGLRGADKICTTIAEMSMPGSAAKGWHAFLSTTTVDARDRIGDGPWYDRNGRTVAASKQALFSGARPQGADPLIANDLPNERGEPNQAGSAVGDADDNHDTLTATNAQGAYDGSSTCGDWTSTTTTGSGMMRGPGLGHTWPAMSGQSWVAAHRAPGCAASVNLTQGFGGGGSGTGVGSLGGYGAIYCFADAP